MKKLVLRKCVACGNLYDKSSLIRFVKKDGEVFVDNTKKINARGAYLCNNEKCIKETFNKRRLNRSFKMEISQAKYDKLLEELSQNV